MHFKFTTLLVVGLVQALPQTLAAPQVVLSVEPEEQWQCFPLTSDIVRYLIGDRIERYGEATFDTADYTVAVEGRPEACLPRPVYVFQYDEIHCSDLGTFGRDDPDDCPDTELSDVYSTDLTISSVSDPPICIPIDFSVPAFAPSDGHVTVTTSPVSSEQDPTLCEASARVTLPMQVSLESLSQGYVDYSWLWLENKVRVPLADILSWSWFSVPSGEWNVVVDLRVTKHAQRRDDSRTDIEITADSRRVVRCDT